MMSAETGSWLSAGLHGWLSGWRRRGLGVLVMGASLAAAPALAQGDGPEDVLSDEPIPALVDAPATVDVKPAAERFDGAERAAIITLGESGDKDMVGLYMTAKALQDAIPLLEQEGVTTVVFRINSGGGLLLEIQRLSDVIQNEYKPRFRVAAWIQSAISAAAMTSHAIEEIYFTPEGNYGACTGFSSGGGTWVAIKDRQLEEVLAMMEQISARGGYAPEIMRSMQILTPLSCSIDSNGDVHWYQNEQGEYLVNPSDRILTFNSQTAEKFGFSRGTASTLDELATAMGLTEVEWVGTNKAGIPWPVSKGEQSQMDYRKKVYDDNRRLIEYQIAYQDGVSIAQSQPRDERGPWVGKARTALGKIKSMVKNNPNFALLNFGQLPSEWDGWVEDREQELRDLMK